MVKSWAEKGPTTKFGNQEYYWTLGKCLQIEDVIKKHSDIMDAKDPHKRIGLLVDEWGTWWDEEAGTIQGRLYQQNTMHDAMVAALTPNVFHRHADRVKMANLRARGPYEQCYRLQDFGGIHLRGQKDRWLYMRIANECQLGQSQNC